jgi:uncharacterized coiled-coil protein SlyX
MTLLEALNEIARLNEIVIIQQKHIERLQSEKKGLIEALYHYRNNPPPHPPQSPDAVATDGCQATVSTLKP